MGWRQEPHAALAMASLTSDILLTHKGYQEGARELAIRLDRYEADLMEARSLYMETEKKLSKAHTRLDAAEEKSFMHKGVLEMWAKEAREFRACAAQLATLLKDGDYAWVSPGDGPSRAEIALAAHDALVKE